MTITTEADRILILAAIEKLRAATNTTVVTAANETVTDGTSVLLQSNDGWYIDIVGCRFQDNYDETVRLQMRGFVYNEKTDRLEALTLHPVRRTDTWLTVRIDTPTVDYFAETIGCLVPAVKEAAAAYHQAIALEKARKGQIEQLKAHFEITGTTKKFQHGAHALELSVSSVASDWNKLGLTLKADGLTPLQVEAIMKLLDDSALPA